MLQFKKNIFILVHILTIGFSTLTYAVPIDPNKDVSGQTYYVTQTEVQEKPTTTETAPANNNTTTQETARYDDKGNKLTTGSSQTDFSTTVDGFQTQIDEYAKLAESIEVLEVEEKSQAAAYDKKSQESDPAKAQEPVKSVATDVAACSAGQILANIISSAVSSAITTATGKAAEEAAGLMYVPTKESGQVLLNSNTQNSAHTGTAVGVFGIGALVLPSWDAVAYCVVNAMIEYVANSTIAWVQGGFEGNPSFVNNPEQFFKDLGNVEAGAFLKELAYGSLGLNICEPFRAQIVLTIARSHVGNQQGYGGAEGGYSKGGFGGGAGGNIGYGGCTLDDIKGNLDGFLNGNFEKGGWDSWFQISQIDSNNPYTTYFNLQSQLNGAINKKTTLAEKELNWGNGFLSFRKCDEKTAKDKQGNCPITSPGVVIQGQLEKTLGLAKDRLVLAEKFDQVIAAVVNQLINTALDKVLEVAAE